MLVMPSSLNASPPLQTASSVTAGAGGDYHHHGFNLAITTANEQLFPFLCYYAWIFHHSCHINDQRVSPINISLSAGAACL